MKTPQQLQEQTVFKASSDSWAAEVHGLLFHGFFAAGSLYPNSQAPFNTAVQTHFVFPLKLLEKRVQSLAAFYLRPPNPNKQTAELLQMHQEWAMVLEVEGRLAKRRSCGHWRLNSVNRYLVASPFQVFKMVTFSIFPYNATGFPRFLTT